MVNVTRKELLKEPDEFMTTTGKILKWIKENPKRSFTVIIVVVLVLGGGLGFYYWRTSREQAAMTAYIKAGSDVKLNADIARKYTDTKAGKLSKLRLAGFSYAKGDNAEAIKTANEFIDSWGSEDVLFYESMMIMAMGYMGQKDMAKAIDVLDKCIKGAPEVLRDQAMFFKAVALKSMGKKQDAMKILQGMVQEQPQSTEGKKGTPDENKGITSAYRDLAKITLSDMTTETGAGTDAK
jgi:predicted negative regulator of RcsB-dependent stress response